MMGFTPEVLEGFVDRKFFRPMYFWVTMAKDPRQLALKGVGWGGHRFEVLSCLGKI